MKILLDECITIKAKKLLPDQDVSTVAEMGYCGLKNGKLLAKASESEFDILITIDKNIDFQQNIEKFQVALVVLDVKKSNLSCIQELMPEFMKQLTKFHKGKAYRIQ
ncbi:MAG: hypothetical protein KKA07_03000 [Bacteroidetes bacterium]|nr:hypothetical protein [Bacteroidota bacterium]MBU1718018.1 hypothetical protein [Bacteroidota bacterium]